MKYETRIKKSIDRLSEEQLLHELLLVRGIENPHEFLNLTEDVIHDPQLLVNMQQGVNMLHYWVTQDKAHIHLLMDTDCFVGSTKIKMLDGTIKTFEELVEMEKANPGQSYWVYSCDKQGKVHAGRAYSPRISCYREEVCVVELDNGKVIECTPDHRFMLRNGEYIQAKELTQGASLMPLYYSYKDYGEKQYYEYIEGQDYTHLVIANDVYGERPKYYHTHHINFNPLDNTPSNLQYLTKEEHMSIHGSYSNLCTKYNGSLKQKEDTKRGRQLGHYDGKSHFIKYNKTEKNKQTTTLMNANEEVKRLQWRGKLSKIGKQIIEMGYDLTIENIKAKPWTKDKNWKTVEVVLHGKKVIKSKQSPTMKTILKYFDSFEDFVYSSQHYNHKVVSVTHKIYEQPIPLYDITVEKYHNFAIDLGDNSGVFVHNCDGLTSSAFMYLWLQRNFSNCILTVDVNEGKRHGLNEDIFSHIPEGTNLMICPDSSSDDIEWHNKLDEVGIDLLILDHHEFNTQAETPACIINNQDGQYPNKAFSAPGVVYKFLDEFEYQHFEDMGKEPNCHEYLDILAVGVVADLCDVRDYETRFLVFKGLERLKQTNNELLKAILLSQEQRIKGDINIETIGWNIAPIINAIFRQGTVEDKLLLFRAIVNEHETMTYIPKKATKNNPNKEPIKETLQEHVIRLANSLKSAQDRASKKEVELFKGEIEQNGFDQNPVIILDVTDKIEAGHTGLVANKLAHQYQRPVLLVNGRGGSFRNYDKFPIEDLSSWLMESELVICKGHSNAGGLDIEKENIELLQNWCKEQLKDHDLTPIYHADLEIPIAKLKNRHINKVGALKDNWGGKNMSKPLFVITGIEIDSADIQRLGKNSTTIKFTTNINGEEITFVRAFSGKDIYSRMICEDVNVGRVGIRREGSGNKKLLLTILGEFETNEWNGKIYPQVKILEFDSKVITKNERRRKFR